MLRALNFLASYLAWDRYLEDLDGWRDTFYD
jgi:hypothetical protein